MDPFLWSLTPDKTREDFLNFLRNFHDIHILKEWADFKGMTENPDVLQRIKDIKYFQSQKFWGRNRPMWNVVLQSFTTQDELMKYANENYLLYDQAVRQRAEQISQV